MMSELNTGSTTGPCSQLDSTQTFILKPVATSQPHQQLSPILPSAPQHHSARNLPVFNADRKHFTPAFLAPSHLAGIVQHDQEYRDAFLIKTQEECLHTSLLLQPKPSSSFCFVCKQHFQDYSKHINHPVHRKFVASSPCEDLIHQLIQSQQLKRRQPVCGSIEPQAPRKMRKQQLRYEDWNLWDLLLLWPCNTSKSQVLVSPFFNPQLTSSDLPTVDKAILLQKSTTGRGGYHRQQMLYSLLGELDVRRGSVAEIEVKVEVGLFPEDDVVKLLQDVVA